MQNLQIENLDILDKKTWKYYSTTLIKQDQKTYITDD